MSSQDENYYAEDWWLEYLEGELEASFAKDMALLLVNSAADKESLAGLRRTRELLKEAGDVALPEDGRIFENMQARIMNEVRTLDTRSKQKGREGVSEKNRDVVHELYLLRKTDGVLIP